MALAPLSLVPRVAAVTNKVIDLPLDQILVGQRLRSVDHAAAEMLAVSMLESGQLTPVLVRPDPAGEGLYELVAGGHRHAAARINGWRTVRADIRELTDAEAALIEVDENLIRRDLSPHERAISLRARLDAWTLRFPERTAEIQGELRPKRGRPGNAPKFGAFRMGFAEQTASEVGLSRQTVGYALAIQRGLSPALHTAITNTWISKREGVLRQLAGIGPGPEQDRVVELLLAGKAKTVSDARALAAGRTSSKAVRSPVDEVLSKHRALWAKASPSAREAILRELAGRSLPGGWRLEGGR